MTLSDHSLSGLLSALKAGEVTDKRSVNQRLVMERRAADVALLYQDPPGERVILPGA